MQPIPRAYGRWGGRKAVKASEWFQDYMVNANRVLTRFPDLRNASSLNRGICRNGVCAAAI